MVCTWQVESPGNYLWTSISWLMDWSMDVSIGGLVEGRWIDCIQQEKEKRREGVRT